MNMLPSMPLLFLSSQDGIINNSPRSSDQKSTDTTFTAKKPGKIEDHHKNGICNAIETDGNLPFESLPLDDRECEDELVLLATSSSPHSEKRKLLLQNQGSKKKKKLENVAGFGNLDEIKNQDDKAHHFAETYFTKAKASLDDASFQKFISTLNGFSEESGDAVELYKEMMKILNGYPDLCQEFVGFLLPHQALDCNLFMEYLFFDKAWKFFRKADAFHLTRILHFLEQHASNPVSSIEQLKNSVLPHLKGHPLLAEAFLELLPNEKPTQSSMIDFEDITGNSRNEGDWERLRMPEHPDRGCGGNTCSCKCHSASILHMCTSCNIKFINGQICVQYGKLMRFARLHFNGANTEDELRRLHPALYIKPRILAKKKTVKSTKGSSSSVPEVPSENQTETAQVTNGEVETEVEACDDLHIKQENEDFELSEGFDDDVIVIEDEDENEDYFEGCFEDDKLSETSSGEGEKSLDSIAGDLNEFEELLSQSELAAAINNEGSLEQTEIKEVETDTVEKAEDVIKVEGEEEEEEEQKIERVLPSTAIKSDDISYSSSDEESGEIVDSDSESSSNDNYTRTKEDDDEELNRIVRENESSIVHSGWTREEDKVILEAFQKELDTEHTFSKISCLIPSRSVHDIQGRFQVLMKLLEKVASGSHETHPT